MIRRALSYLNARYYDAARGQFTRQDPVHLAIGNRNELLQLAQLDQNKLLADPQALNSYSYSKGNPLVNKDSTGLYFEPLSAIACAYTAYSVGTLAVDGYEIYLTSFSKYSDVFTEEERNRALLKAGYDVASLGIGFKLARDAGKVAEVAFDTLGAGQDIRDAIKGEQDPKVFKDARELNNRKSAPPGTNTNNVPRTTSYTNAATQMSNQGGDSRYNQLVGGLSRLVSSLKAYVSSLQASKDKKK